MQNKKTHMPQDLSVQVPPIIILCNLQFITKQLNVPSGLAFG